MYAIRGIDVSKWQGKVGWKKERRAGIRFAFIKAGGAGYYGKNSEEQFGLIPEYRLIILLH
jgi:GH25 family lysozyme M1 (1,4-beta-N-acetylmuramidase)